MMNSPDVPDQVGNGPPGAAGNESIEVPLRRIRQRQTVVANRFDGTTGREHPLTRVMDVVHRASAGSLLSSSDFRLPRSISAILKNP
jgi:hypothetical protein